MPIQLTETAKDRILDMLLVVSILLFIFGVVSPSVPRRTQDPPRAVYTPARLAELSSKQRPEFEELTLIEGPERQSGGTTSTAHQPATAQVASSTTQPGISSQSPVDIQPTGVVSRLTDILRGLL